MFVLFFVYLFLTDFVSQLCFFSFFFKDLIFLFLNVVHLYISEDGFVHVNSVSVNAREGCWISWCPSYRQVRAMQWLPGNRFLQPSAVEICAPN